jgi:predicted site-specific integrase-resolvase
MSSPNADDEILLTRKEVALLCRVDVRTVDRWLRAQKIAFQRTPSGRVLFRKHDVLMTVDAGRRMRGAMRRPEPVLR